jgi:pimeloyl-ACP methyl ester carboxylesterase
MYMTVNGVRLFFDVEGAKLVPDGPVMREKPVLLMLHGGPGADHSIYRPAYSALADIAQIVYLDHRGNGRSEDGPKERWNLAQWGDDVRAFCDALGIVDPIVLGASFGGMAALAYATRHPDHPRQARADQHRSRRWLVSGAPRGAVRTLWRPGSRRAGTPAVLDARGSA